MTLGHFRAAVPVSKILVLHVVVLFFFVAAESDGKHIAYSSVQ